jgi:hypothetical protein
MRDKVKSNKECFIRVNISLFYFYFYIFFIPLYSLFTFIYLYTIIYIYFFYNIKRDNKDVVDFFFYSGYLLRY